MKIEKANTLRVTETLKDFIVLKVSLSKVIPASMKTACTRDNIEVFSAKGFYGEDEVRWVSQDTPVTLADFTKRFQQKGHKVEVTPEFSGLDPAQISVRLGGDQWQTVAWLDPIDRGNPKMVAKVIEEETDLPAHTQKQVGGIPAIAQRHAPIRRL